MKTIKLREIVKAVTEDIHMNMPSMIRYEGVIYYRTATMINYCSCKDDKLLRVDLLDLNYDQEVEVIDNEEEINYKKNEIERLRARIDVLEKEINDLEKYC